MITDNPFDLSGETPAAADTRLVAATLRLRVRTAASLSVRLIPMLDSAKTSVRDELKRGFISLLYSGMELLLDRTHCVIFGNSIPTLTSQKVLPPVEPRDVE